MNGLRKSLRDAEISNFVSINPTTFKNSFQIRVHYLFTARSWRCKQYSTSEFAFFAPSFKAWIRYFKTFFVPFSPLTSKHCDRYVFTFEPIFIFLKYCFHVTSTNESLIGTLSQSWPPNEQLIIDWKREISHILYYLFCVKCSVLLTFVTIFK